MRDIADDVVRNEQITWGYQLLGADLARFVRGGAVNWPYAAQWASYTIGIGIRTGGGSDLGAGLRATDPARHERARAFDSAISWARRCFPSVTEEQSRALGEGNRDVFFQIGEALQLLFLWFEEHPWADDLDGLRTHLAVAIAEVEPAESLTAAPSHLLVDGLMSYAAAHLEREEAVREELAVAGDLYLAVYEQLRLQPVAERCFWAAPDFVMRPFVGRGRGLVARAVTRLRDLLRFAVAWLVTNTLLVYLADDVELQIRGGWLGAPTCAPSSRGLAAALDEVEQRSPGARIRRLPWTDARRRVMTAAEILLILHDGPRAELCTTPREPDGAMLAAA